MDIRGIRWIGIVWAMSLSATAQAQLIPITNASFEDTTGQTVFNEFTFGTPAGWINYNDPLISDPGVFVGTLDVHFPGNPGPIFFNTDAPDGDLVLILFNRNATGGLGEYGVEQTITTDQLQANTRSTLTVQVGNIASGTTESNEFFDLRGFPGYRVALMAGGVEIESVQVAEWGTVGPIGEGDFAEITVTADIGDSHAQLGQDLGIRLVNLNLIPGEAGLETVDLEVDFDQLTLNATPIPEPSTWALLTLAAIGTVVVRCRQCRR